MDNAHAARPVRTQWSATCLFQRHCIIATPERRTTKPMRGAATLNSFSILTMKTPFLFRCKTCFVRKPKIHGSTFSAKNSVNKMGK